MEMLETSTFYTPLNDVLEAAYNKYIKMNRKESKLTFAYLEKKIDIIIKAMKYVDEGFDAMYNRLYPVGSFFDKLKIFKPIEFDYNIIMTLPLYYNKIKIIKEHNCPRFVKLHVGDAFKTNLQSDGERRAHSLVKMWTDGQGYLCEGRIRQWLEGVITKAVNSRTHPELQQFLLRKSGPALTLSVIVGKNQVDIDFVCALEFSPLQASSLGLNSQVTPSNSWLLITKSIENKNLWQMSFPVDERELLSCKGNLKLVCKLLKGLKESADHLKLASYYLKTLFMWEVLTQRKSDTFWDKNLGYLFVILVMGITLADVIALRRERIFQRRSLLRKHLESRK